MWSSPYCRDTENSNRNPLLVSLCHHHKTKDPQWLNRHFLENVCTFCKSLCLLIMCGLVKTETASLKFVLFLAWQRNLFLLENVLCIHENSFSCMLKFYLECSELTVYMAKKNKWKCWPFCIQFQYFYFSHWQVPGWRWILSFGWNAPNDVRRRLWKWWKWLSYFTKSKDFSEKKRLRMVCLWWLEVPLHQVCW